MFFSFPIFSPAAKQTIFIWPDQVLSTDCPIRPFSFSILADLRTRQLSMWSDQQTRQSSCYQTTRLDNFPVIRPPNQTIFLSTDYYTGAFSSERHSTSLDHLFWSTAWPDHLPSQFTVQLQICTEQPSSLQTCIQVRTYPHGLGHGGLIYIYRILGEPCKAYTCTFHTSSVWNHLDFLFRLVFCFYFVLVFCFP